MDRGRFDAWTRRRLGLGLSGLAAGLLGVASGGESLARKKKGKKKKGSPPNPCAGKNHCLDASHTCNGGNGFCRVTLFGGNVCSSPGLPVASCSQCTSGQTCVLGGGCGNQFLCVII